MSLFVAGSHSRMCSGAAGGVVSALACLVSMLPVLFMVGCGETAIRELGVRTDTLAGGGLFVRNGPSGAWRDGAGWRLEEDLRIGRVEGGGPEVFGRVQALSADGLGRLWVADRLNTEIRVFDGEGRYVRTVGRGGAGPGEFSSALMDVALAPDGSVWVSDPRQGRLQVFDRAGRFIASHPMPTGRPHDEAIVFDSTGMVVHTVEERVRSNPSRFAIRRDPQSFEAIDTLPPVEPLAEPPRFSDLSAREPRTTVWTVRTIPFAHQPAMRLHEEGSHYVGWPGRGAYRFGSFRMDGDTILMVEREFEPVRIPEDVLEERLGSLRGPAAEALPTEAIPEAYPPFDEVHQAPDGHWWVRRTLGPEQVIYDIFAPDGVYLGPVETDLDVSRFKLLHLTNDALYGVWHGNLDTPYVVRLAVLR